VQNELVVELNLINLNLNLKLATNKLQLQNSCNCNCILYKNVCKLRLCEIRYYINWSWVHI